MAIALLFVVLVALLALSYGAPFNISLVKIVGAGGTTITSGNAISLLANGNVVLGGSTNGNVAAPLSGSTNAFLQCFDISGEIVWSKQLAAGSNAEIVGSDKDTDDYVYAAIRCTGPFHGGTYADDYDVCVVKYDAQGNQVFTLQAGTAWTDMVHSIAVNQADRSSWVAGYTTSTAWEGQMRIGNVDAFLMHISPDGVKSAVHRFGVIGNKDTAFYGAAVDSHGDVWSTGYTTGAAYKGVSNSGSHADILVQKTSPNGTVHFATLIGGATDSDFGTYF
jgi:hypothetical protein